MNNIETFTKDAAIGMNSHYANAANHLTLKELSINASAKKILSTTNIRRENRHFVPALNQSFRNLLHVKLRATQYWMVARADVKNFYLNLPHDSKH